MFTYILFYGFFIPVIVLILYMIFSYFHSNHNLSKCPRQFPVYRYELTVKNLAIPRNSICELLSTNIVMAPIKISKIIFNDTNTEYRLDNPILWFCGDLNEQYIQQHYPNIYKSRCFAIVDKCKIIKNGLFSVIYEYQEGFISFLNFDSDIQEILNFTKELRNYKSRIYKNIELHPCQKRDNCPLLYIDIVKESQDPQRNKKCFNPSWKKLIRIN